MTKPMQRKDFTNTVISLIRDHRLSELHQLIEENDQPLPETAVRMGYRIFTEQEQAFRTRFFLIKRLKEITRIEPEETIVQTLLKGMIGCQPPAVFKLVCHEMNIRPALFRALNRDIQDWYKKMLDSNQYSQVSQLQSITQVAPDAAMIQETYKSYLISGHMISYTGLQKQLGIDPQPAMVQQVYNHFRSALGANSSTHAADKENIRRWYDKVQEMTGIPDNSQTT